jgi:hypothetical protein
VSCDRACVFPAAFNFLSSSYANNQKMKGSKQDNASFLVEVLITLENLYKNVLGGAKA